MNSTVAMVTLGVPWQDGYRRIPIVRGVDLPGDPVSVAIAMAELARSNRIPAVAHIRRGRSFEVVG